MTCERCDRYDSMGYGQQCPCTHVNGKCTTPVIRYNKMWLTKEELDTAIAALRAERGPPVADELLPPDPVSHSPPRSLNVQPNNGIIYAIIDLKADAIVGGLQLHRSDASAIRTFGDIASAPDTTVGKHVEDYELRRMAYIDTDNHICGRTITKPNGEPHLQADTIITGAQWKAAQALTLTKDD